MVATHLEAVVLTQDAAMNRLDDHLLLHAEVQGLHCTAGAEQGLVGSRLLQPWHQMGPEEVGNRDVTQGQASICPFVLPLSPLLPEKPFLLTPIRSLATDRSRGMLHLLYPLHTAV